MLFKLTYSLASSKSVQREASFESETKAMKFVQAYNVLNAGAKIIRVTKLVSELSLKDMVAFVNQNINQNDYFNLKVLYETMSKQRFNMTIPFLDTGTTSPTDIKNLLVYVQNFSKDIKMDYKKSY